MSADVYIGLDPGKGGGLALLSAEGALLDCARMPETMADRLAWLRDRLAGQRALAALERVGATPQMGVTSAFTFGRELGSLEMLLAALGVPFDLVAPGKWQQALGCRSGGDKNVTKARAQQLFPAARVTHAIADALLLAEYARRRDVLPRFNPSTEAW